ncbi:hypothetical protein LX36DRAFT_284744 [Colletotrichum falcatum]|nr:hypothetical protein LX36DRAFT_284744 [Colletotrichum falcatum]
MCSWKSVCLVQYVETAVDRLGVLLGICGELPYKKRFVSSKVSRVLAFENCLNRSELIISQGRTVDKNHPRASPSARSGSRRRVWPGQTNMPCIGMYLSNVDSFQECKKWRSFWPWPTWLTVCQRSVTETKVRILLDMMGLLTGTMARAETVVVSNSLRVSL